MSLSEYEYYIFWLEVGERVADAIYREEEEDKWTVVSAQLVSQE